MIGRTVSKYRILDLVGQGGMGVVYRAEDQDLGRTVALKFLPPELTRDSGARARFLNEARAASALDHRNVCVVHDIAETDDGQLYIIMPYYRGESLESRVDRGPLAPVDAVAVLAQVCAGLGRAHEQQILHRDLKPANLFLTYDGEVKILDFGVAKLADSSSITRTGGVVGTLAYMAPEQLRDEPADVRTEIWSLGVILFEILTGEPPFRAGTRAATITAILHRQPDLGDLRKLAGEGLCAVARRCLSPRAADRYPSVASLLDDLDRLGKTVAAPHGRRPALVRPPESIPTQDFGVPSRARREGGDQGGDRRWGVTTSSEAYEGSSATSGERPFTTIVGRRGQLEILESRLAAAESGKGQLALIRGEEGRGKSTLVRELARRADREERFLAATGSFDSHASASDPFSPFRQVLALLAGELTAEDLAGSGTRDRLARIEQLAPQVIGLIASHGPLLVDTFVSGHQLLERSSDFTGLDSRAREALEAVVAVRSSRQGQDPGRNVLFDQYTAVIRAVSELTPLVVIVEDLHWADGGSMELMTHLARGLRSSRVLLVGTYRFEEVTRVPGRSPHPLEPALHELARSFGDVEIDLDLADGRRFIDELVDSEPNRLDAEFRARLFESTGGLPLFATELLRELSECAVLAPDRTGRWLQTGAVDWDLLPRRVEALAAERIGRLSEELRSVLTAASVQGEEFVAEIVAQVLGLDERQTLRWLSNEAARRHRIVVAAGVRHVAGNRQSLYRFRHALFRRFLYEALDRVESALLHEDTAVRMQAMVGDRDDEFVARLGAHYRAAGITEEAVECLRRAGQRAVRFSAHPEAVRHFLGALEELSRLEPSRARMEKELEIRTAMASVQIAIHGFASREVEETYLKARELCERLPEASDFPLLWGLFAFSSVRGEFDRSLPLAERMLSSAESLPEKIQSEYAVGVTKFFLGHLGEAGEHLVEASEPASRPEVGSALITGFSQDSRKVAAAYVSWVLWIRGEPRAARDAARAAERWARQDVHPFTLSTVLFLTGFVHLLAGDGESVRAQGDEMHRLSDEFGLFQSAEAELLRSLADLGKDAPTASGAALDRLTAAIQDYRGRQWAVFVPFLVGALAWAHLEVGDADSARDCLQEASSVAEAGGESFWIPELLRLRGQVAADRDTATTLTRRALDLAQEQGARWLVLRAAISLAELGHDSKPLANILASFPVDAHLPDLVRARVVLAEASARAAVTRKPRAGRGRPGR